MKCHYFIALISIWVKLLFDSPSKHFSIIWYNSHIQYYFKKKWYTIRKYKFVPFGHWYAGTSVRLTTCWFRWPHLERAGTTITMSFHGTTRRASSATMRTTWRPVSLTSLHESAGCTIVRPCRQRWLPGGLRVAATARTTSATRNLTVMRSGASAMRTSRRTTRKSCRRCNSDYRDPDSEWFEGICCFHLYYVPCMCIVQPFQYWTRIHQIKWYLFNIGVSMGILVTSGYKKKPLWDSDWMDNSTTTTATWLQKDR